MSEETTVSRKNLTFYKGFSILDGKLFSGVCVDYHDNRRKKYEGPFKNGKEDGLCIHWYENGQKEAEGYYRDGTLDGLWSYWDENGQKESEGNFNDEMPDGLIIRWHINGEKKSEGHMVNGQKRVFGLSGMKTDIKNPKNIIKMEN